MAEPYLFPISILKEIEPWLTEYFAYQRYHIQPEIEQAFEAKYHKVEDFLKVSNEHIDHITHIHLAECDHQFLDKLETIINKYSPFENEEKIFCSLWIASVLYRMYDNFGKDHSNFGIDYLEQRDMFDQYSKHIRPEMLKLLTFLKGRITTTNKQTEFQTPLPIRIEAGAERIEIDNTAGWFVGALEEYLHTFLGVETKEAAEEELKTVYSSKGRKLDAGFALMMGTYHLLTAHSKIKPKSKIIRLTLDFLELLDLASENDDENLKDYIRYNATEDKFVVNDMAGKLELYKYKLKNLVYHSGKNLMNVYRSSGLETTDVMWEVVTEELKEDLGNKQSFEDTLKEYIQLKEQYPLGIGGRISEIEEEYPFLSNALHTLGDKQLLKLRSQKKIKEALNPEDLLDDLRIVKEIEERYELGSFISNPDTKALAKQYGGTTDKALEKWISLKVKQTTINGVCVKGYVITGFKRIFD